MAKTPKAEQSIEINGVKYLRAPSTEALTLKLEEIGAKQRRGRIERDRIERQMATAEKAEDYEKADELLGESEKKSAELVSLGFEIASASLVNEAGESPEHGSIDFEKVAEFLGWNGDDVPTEPDPTPSSA